ncbi:major facilitator superfamily domain-containing protein [Melampsora americana]|nr:major facilitator superfamily domain-containing protein [Melampsora americana]
MFSTKSSQKVCPEEQSTDENSLKTLQCSVPTVLNDKGTLCTMVCEEKLPPIDCGRGAWTYLGAAFTLETIIWVSALICFLSIFASSFATSCIHVFWSQGVGYGIGGAALYHPALSFLPEWFSARRGLANGVIFAGTGLGGLIFPFLIDMLLGKFGVKETLQIISCMMAVMMGVSVILIRPRIVRVSNSSISMIDEPFGTLKEAENMSKNPLKWFERQIRWPFAIYLVSNTLQAIGYYIPNLYLPSALNPLNMVCCGAILARILVGILSDHYSPHLIGAVTSLAGGASTLLIWGGFGNHGFIPLLTYSFFFGCTSGTWTSLFFGVVRVWLRNPHLTMTAYGIISLTRGLGNIIAGPISSRLISITVPTSEIKTGFDVDSYSKVIWFSGFGLIITFILEVILWILQ